jgi:hypothetical protein
LGGVGGAGLGLLIFAGSAANTPPAAPIITSAEAKIWTRRDKDILPALYNGLMRFLS